MKLTPGAIKWLRKGAPFPEDAVTAVDDNGTIYKPGQITKDRYIPNKHGVFEDEFQPVLRVDYVDFLTARDSKITVTDGDDYMLMMVTDRTDYLRNHFWSSSLSPHHLLQLS